MTPSPVHAPAGCQTKGAHDSAVASVPVVYRPGLRGRGHQTVDLTVEGGVFAEAVRFYSRFTYAPPSRQDGTAWGF